MIYIQSNNKIPMWDFGSSALHGCLNTGKSYKLCEDWNMPGSDATCLVGSVEWCTKWMEESNILVPSAIDIKPFSTFLRRNWYTTEVETFLKENVEWPAFVKPYKDIKAFTGTQVLSKSDAELVLRDFTGELMVQQVVDPIFSEWRVYVNRKKVVGIKHYKGDHLIFPNKYDIRRVVDFAIENLDNVSFTLDFGVFNYSGEPLTFLIEPNDGWAIGNYGLEPEDYLRFCEDRWKQLIK